MKAKINKEWSQIETAINTQRPGNRFFRPLCILEMTIMRRFGVLFNFSMPIFSQHYTRSLSRRDEVVCSINIMPTRMRASVTRPNMVLYLVLSSWRCLVSQPVRTRIRASSLVPDEHKIYFTNQSNKFYFFVMFIRFLGQKSTSFLVS